MAMDGLPLEFPALKVIECDTDDMTKLRYYLEQTDDILINWQEAYPSDVMLISLRIKLVEILQLSHYWASSSPEMEE